MLLGLALGSADRDLTLARLTTMGLEQGRLTRLVLGETLLAVVAAVAAAVACAVALPTLTSTALDLSVFTGSSAPVPIGPDLVPLPCLPPGWRCSPRSRWSQKRDCSAIVTCLDC